MFINVSSGRSDYRELELLNIPFQAKNFHRRDEIGNRDFSAASAFCAVNGILGFFESLRLD
jgi:hypothetical protein